MSVFSDIRRRLRFVAVGGFCFAVQMGVLDALRRFGMPRPAANAIGFVLSAQVNFALSSVLTWRDRATSDRRAVAVRMAAYNATALLSLAVNTAVFTVLYATVGDLPAAAAGVVAGMGLTYLGCDRLIFRAVRRSEGVAEPAPAGANAAPSTAVAAPAVASTAVPAAVNLVISGLNHDVLVDDLSRAVGVGMSSGVPSGNFGLPGALHVTPLPHIVPLPADVS